jgi:hypothetical protein
MFWFNNILFSNEVSPKFEQLGARKDKSVLDSGLAGNNENFWQEIAEKYQEKNDDYDLLAYNNAFFDGIDPSVKLEHNWSKLQEIYEGLTKSYGEVFENTKKGEIMIISSIFVVLEVKCTTYIYGWRKSHSYRTWLLLIYLRVFSLIAATKISLNSDVNHRRQHQSHHFPILLVRVI